MSREIREKVRVTMHLPGEYTKVLVERTEGVGMAGGGICLDIPTEIIPFHLRGIGCRFLFIGTTLTAPEAATMSADDIRQMQTMSAEEIKDE
jgi:hypothetical protein